MDLSVEEQLTDDYFQYSQSRKKLQSTFQSSQLIDMDSDQELFFIRARQITDLVNDLQIDSQAKIILIDAIQQLQATSSLQIQSLINQKHQINDLFNDNYDQQQIINGLEHQINNIYKQKIIALNHQLEETKLNYKQKNMEMINQQLIKQNENNQLQEQMKYLTNLNAGLKDQNQQLFVSNTKLHQQIEHTLQNINNLQHKRNQKQTVQTQVFTEQQIGNDSQQQEQKLLQEIKKSLGVKPEQDILKVIKRYNKFNQNIQALIVSLVPNDYFKDKLPNFKDLWNILKQTIQCYQNILKQQNYTM